MTDTKFMAVMDEFFAFKIGDLVKVKHTNPQACNWMKSTTLFHVVGQTAERCAGGLEKTYECRAVFCHGGISTELAILNEIELELSPGFEEMDRLDQKKRKGE